MRVWLCVILYFLWFCLLVLLLRLIFLFWWLLRFFFHFLHFLFILFLLLNNSFLMFQFLFFPLAFSLILLLSFYMIIDSNLPEIMLSQQQRKIPITVTLHTQNNLILLFRKRWILRIHIFHNIDNLLRIHNTHMLKPYNLTMYPTIITIRSHIFCDLFKS